MRKVHTLRPAVQAQSSDFTLTITKNNIRSTGVKLASPHLVFADYAAGIAEYNSCNNLSSSSERCGSSADSPWQR